MKKFLNAFNFLGKALLLIVLLIFGWVFINATNLIKGKKAADKNGDSNSMWGPDSANADAPPPPGGGGTCPHVALWDGNKFCIENDFLLGKPQSFAVDQKLIRGLYEQGLVGPDLMKFSSPMKKYNGKIALQLQEIEEEETFVDSLQLIRVIHPAKSEVIPNVNFNQYHVFSEGALEKNTHQPQRVTRHNGEDVTLRFRDIHFLSGLSVISKENTFNSQDMVTFTFSGLRNDQDPLVIIQACFRDWMMGPGPVSSAPVLFSFLNRRMLTRAASLLTGALYMALGTEHAAGVFALAPLFMGMQTHCIKFSYADAAGCEHIVTIHDPRDWRYATEAISFPREAVRNDGTMVVKAEFTKRHALRFVGVTQGGEEIVRREEALNVTGATHSREGNLGDILTRKDTRYAHMIPGDTIDLTFEDPHLEIRNNDEQETYLMQSSGFYTSLSSKYRQIAGDWQSGLSPEARAHYQELTALRS